MKPLLLGILLTLSSSFARAQVHALPLPPRPENALSGSDVARQIADLPKQEREQRIEREVLSGNVPDFLRKLVAVPIAAKVGGKTYEGKIFVAPDYLAVGSNSDYFFTPLTPYTAQRIEDRLGCTLPTPKMVDAIYEAATVKLTPSPIPPTPAMTTVPVFVTHNQTVWQQRSHELTAGPLGSLVAGDKKDIVICAALADTPGHVAIYGWHKPDSKPIQPLYLGHVAIWADYSHGIRLVDSNMEIDGKPTTVQKILSDSELSILLSSEGPVQQPRYKIRRFPREDDPTIHLPDNERLLKVTTVPGVRVLINEPKEILPKVRLVLFALPNGNTIEQTFGRKSTPDDDWHFDIQHIGAQTRFVRHAVPGESLIVAYIEASNHAWPQWLHGKDPKVTETVVNSILSRYSDRDLRVVLDSHSGGGAFELAYINAVEAIPAPIDRIAFLDSEYNYESPLHHAKLSEWLKVKDHSLCIIAYDDASARYKGKPFVSAEGGTWGRSHVMLSDLGSDFTITRTNTGDPERFVGLDGRVVFLLKENPKGEIFHTVQVERNGFIESLLSGTPLEEKGYRYFGRRAYSRLIHE